jgi:hypothetical protein
MMRPRSSQRRSAFSRRRLTRDGAIRRAVDRAGRPRRTSASRRAYLGGDFFDSSTTPRGTTFEAVVTETVFAPANQYTIAYAPFNQALDGTYRTIRVTVSPPEHLAVRTRAGYRATPVRRQVRGDGRTSSRPLRRAVAHADA